MFLKSSQLYMFMLLPMFMVATRSRALTSSRESMSFFCHFSSQEAQNIGYLWKSLDTYFGI